MSISLFLFFLDWKLLLFIFVFESRNLKFDCLWLIELHKSNTRHNLDDDSFFLQIRKLHTLIDNCWIHIMNKVHFRYVLEKPSQNDRTAHVFRPYVADACTTHCIRLHRTPVVTKVILCKHVINDHDRVTLFHQKVVDKYSFNLVLQKMCFYVLISNKY